MLWNCSVAAGVSGDFGVVAGNVNVGWVGVTSVGDGSDTVAGLKPESGFWAGGFGCPDVPAGNVNEC